LKLEGKVEVFAVKIDKNDDLPAPDGPMIVTNYPDLISPLKFSKIGLFSFLSIRVTLIPL
jgi:hypothetical protein